MQTAASGARVITKKDKARKAFTCIVDMDLKNNRGILRDKSTIDWDLTHGTSVEFVMDGRIQLNGEGGLLNYIRGTVLLNPHMTLSYDISDTPPATIERVVSTVPKVPEATEPHPHTMKLGEFISHARLFGRTKVSKWLKEGFSRVNDSTLKLLVSEQKLKAQILEKSTDALPDAEFKELFSAIQAVQLPAPSTSSVLSIGEDGLALSIRRLGDIDFFAVLTRKPIICDFKPVQVEVAIARIRERTGADQDEPVQVLRFANRVPLQFDKAACAIVKAITSINWRSYGLKQPKGALPLGPYIIAVSVVSPFIRFKNASKETIDASDELVEEFRRALMQSGQRLSRYLSREHKAGELEQRVQHIEQFGPILVEGLARILGASDERKERATAGLAKILEKDTKGIKKDLEAAEDRLATYLEEKKQRLQGFFAELEQEAQRKDEGESQAEASDDRNEDTEEATEATEKKPKNKKKAEGAVSSATRTSSKGAKASKAKKKGAK
jgi:DNA topoisomerase-6 subunit B